MKKNKNPHEQHIRVGRYLKDAVYAASDGIVATFAIVAAAVGGGLAPGIILIIGVADMIAEAISMAAADYLGTRSERDFYKKEEAEEWEEVRREPEDERREVRGILAGKGYAGRDLDEMTRLITANRDYWIRFMMQEELKLPTPEDESPIRSSMVTFFSFMVAGSIPLLPYVLFGARASFFWAAASTGAALFVVGVLRGYFSKTSWILLGLEMLAVGGFASGVAYGIGAMIRVFLP